MTRSGERESRVEESSLGSDTNSELDEETEAQNSKSMHGNNKKLRELHSRVGARRKVTRWDSHHVRMRRLEADH